MTTMSTPTPTDDLESVASFQARARAWLADNMPRIPEGHRWDPLAEDDDRANRARMLQAKLWEGGFAGICYPKQYGGLGLTMAHQRAFDEESAPYELPYIFSTPTHSICGPTILDCGTEEQKLKWIPPMLKGEHLWVQFMSEPSGGSDMAGALTRATRDGDVFLLSGSKIWSTYAYRADYAVCLARTDWDQPKHRGLTFFIAPVHDPRTTIVHIEMVDGNKEFCQEYFDDLEIPVDHVVGKINDGWTVASRLLFYEKTAVGGASPYVSVPMRSGGETTADEIIALARESGRLADPAARRKIAQHEILAAVMDRLTDRIQAGLRTKHFPDQAGAIARLFGGTSSMERTDIVFDLAGDSALSWPEGGDGRHHAMSYLQRQASCIGGGTTEMARNVISERILAMPREHTPDKELPFAQVRRSG